jgi:hypothetical protein
MKWINGNMQNGWDIRNGIFTRELKNMCVIAYVISTQACIRPRSAAHAQRSAGRAFDVMAVMDDGTMIVEYTD